MAILENCEIHFAKLDPKRPNARYNPKNPTWEIQMRTTVKEQKLEWEAAGIKVVAVRDDEEGPVKYWRANLRKKSIKSDGEDGKAPKVIDGDMEDVDPNSIGNGSIGNVRIFRYDYNDKETNKSGTASVLMGVQLTKHILYVPKARDHDDDFKQTRTERVAAAADDAADSSDDEDFTPQQKPSPNGDANEIF